jgi:hypothetical protein
MLQKSELVDYLEALIERNQNPQINGKADELAQRYFSQEMDDLLNN